MVATRWPACNSATAICMAVVDLPEPPFSLPRTMTCAENGLPTSACINIGDETLWGTHSLTYVAARDLVLLSGAALEVKIQHHLQQVNRKPVPHREKRNQCVRAATKVAAIESVSQIAPVPPAPRRQDAEQVDRRRRRDPRRRR